MNAPILNKTDIRTLREAIASLHDCSQKLEQAKAAGIPCDDECERCTHLMRTLMKYLEVFGPQVP